MHVQAVTSIVPVPTAIGPCGDMNTDPQVGSAFGDGVTSITTSMTSGSEHDSPLSELTPLVNRPVSLPPDDEPALDPTLVLVAAPLSSVVLPPPSLLPCA